MIHVYNDLPIKKYTTVWHVYNDARRKAPLNARTLARWSSISGELKTLSDTVQQKLLPTSCRRRLSPTSQYCYKWPLLELSRPTGSRDFTISKPF
uniref:Uncharacterized protein n=1 Tax=Rhipicephalus zambeziensis TaxID=60191 RepID=A0A224Y7M5_9ACAR